MPEQRRNKLNIVLTYAVFCLCGLSFLLSQSHADELKEGWLSGEFHSVEELVNGTPTEHDFRSSALPLLGGAFWHWLPITIDEENDWVLDFKNSSVIGNFQHYIIDANNNVVARYDGGIQNLTPNPYLLRHGRDLNLPAGNYTVATLMTSPFLLAPPKPALFVRANYIQSIKIGNFFTLIGIGVFFALGIYYLVLGFTRRQPTDYFYAVFIWANLIYNATALNLFSDIFSIPIFYSIGLPIMASNMAYIAFVMALFGINKQRTPVLYKIGFSCLIGLASLWLLVPFLPNFSLQFARIGVAVFGIYGISCGIIMAIRRIRTAYFYLIANIAFIIPGAISIIVQSTPGSTLFIEHIGLLAVALEVILLSLVLNYQISMVYKEKAVNLAAAEEALKLADNAIKTKERFLANISHELRTPLNAIQGSVDLLSIRSKDKEVLQHVEVIRHSSSFLLFLINDILDLAKLNADMLVIEKRPFDLPSMIKQISSIYGSSFTVNSNAKFELNISPNIPKYIVSDEKRIEQVIANLLSNAFKFTDQGKVVFNVSLSENEDFIHFSISDSGIGIPAESLNTMFSAFTQADSSISRKYGGTGLGLRIASKIIELMGGKIAAESKPGEGSNFWFTIPIELASNTEVTHDQRQNSEAIEDISFPDFDIVVIDDNSVNLKVISGLLQKLNVAPTTFNNAHEGILYIQKSDIDLVIMDVQMPEIDGLTATKMLREQNFKQPIIGFTANASEDDQIACFEAGMNDILIKPIKLQNLIQVLRKWRGRLP